MSTITIWLLLWGAVFIVAAYALHRMGGIGEGDAIEEPDFETWRRETYDRWQDNRVRVPHAEDC